MSKISYLRKKPVRFLFSSKTNLLLVFLLVTLGLHLLIFWQILLLNQLAFRWANRPVPSLVQLASGNTAITYPVGSKERTPAVVKKFVASTMSLLFNWTGQLPNSEEKANPSLSLDPGVIIGNNQAKITTAAYEAGFALAEDFRRDFLRNLAQMTPPSVFSGDTQSVLLIEYLSEPELIHSGSWRIKMIASMLLFRKTNQVGEAIPVNKEILVKAILPPTTFAENSTPLQQLIYQIRSAGLEIELIRDLPDF